MLRFSRKIQTFHLSLSALVVGGFSKVYLGEHFFLHSYKALKVLHASLVNKRAEQFEHEAQILARLRYPRIVRALDFNVHSGMICPDLKLENMLLGIKGKILIDSLGKRHFILETLRRLAEDQLSIDKMYCTFLIDLANRIHFDKQSTPLQQAFLKVHSHQASLLNLAYNVPRSLSASKST